MSTELVATTVFLDYHRVSELLQFFNGNVSRIAQQLNCSRRVVDDYINSYPQLVAIREDIRESVVDIAEDNLFQAVAEGDLTVSAMIVKTIGRERGYATRVENKVDVIDANEVKDRILEARKRAMAASADAARESQNV
jgi:hypothetical protein